MATTLRAGSRITIRLGDNLINTRVRQVANPHFIVHYNSYAFSFSAEGNTWVLGWGHKAEIKLRRAAQQSAVLAARLTAVEATDRADKFKNKTITKLRIAARIVAEAGRDAERDEDGDGVLTAHMEGAALTYVLAQLDKAEVA